MPKQRIVAIAVLALVVFAALMGKQLLSEKPLDMTKVVDVLWNCEATFDGDDRGLMIIFRQNTQVSYKPAGMNLSNFYGGYSLDGRKFHAEFIGEHFPNGRIMPMDHGLLMDGTFVKATGDTLEMKATTKLEGTPDQKIEATCHR